MKPVTTSMGKTFKPAPKDKYKEKRQADHGVKESDRHHEKTKERDLLRHYKHNWQDLEDGD